MTPSSTGSPASCPTCGAPARDGQLVCLECGSRVALGYRRPPSWRVPAAILMAVLLLAAAATALALKGVGADAEREVERTPIKVGDQKQRGGGAGAGRQDGSR